MTEFYCGWTIPLNQWIYVQTGLYILVEGVALNHFLDFSFFICLKLQ